MSRKTVQCSGLQAAELMSSSGCVVRYITGESINTRWVASKLHLFTNM